MDRENVDALIIAVGSAPLIPPVEGLDGSQVVVVNDYYLKQDQVEDEVVVLGGGLAGCEAAIHLAQEGKCVTVVEMRDEVAVDANIRHRPILLTELADKNVRLCTGYRGLRVTREGVICLNPEGKEELVPGKTVICAAGQRARREVADSLLGTAPYIAQIGDCVRPSTITTAVYQGISRCA